MSEQAELLDRASSILGAIILATTGVVSACMAFNTNDGNELGSARAAMGVSAVFGFLAALLILGGCMAPAAPRERRTRLPATILAVHTLGHHAVPPPVNAAVVALPGVSVGDPLPPIRPVLQGAFSLGIQKAAEADADADAGEPQEPA